MNNNQGYSDTLWVEIQGKGLTTCLNNDFSVSDREEHQLLIFCNQDNYDHKDEDSWYWMFWVWDVVGDKLVHEGHIFEILSCNDSFRRVTGPRKLRYSELHETRKLVVVAFDGLEPLIFDYLEKKEINTPSDNKMYSGPSYINSIVVDRNALLFRNSRSILYLYDLESTEPMDSNGHVFGKGESFSLLYEVGRVDTFVNRYFFVSLKDWEVICLVMPSDRGGSVVRIMVKNEDSFKQVGSLELNTFEMKTLSISKRKDGYIVTVFLVDKISCPVRHDIDIPFS